MTIFSVIQDQQLMNGLDSINSWVKTWAIPLAAIGTISMAFLQTLKNVLPLRKWYQQRHFDRWIDRVAASFPEELAVRHDGTKVELVDPKLDLANLAASGDTAALYSLPSDQLFTQIRGVTPVILDYPRSHEWLLYCFVSQASLDDVREVLNPPDPEVLAKLPHAHTEAEKARIKAFVAAKTRLGAQMRCTMDALKASMDYRWKRNLQIAALLLSALLGVITLHMNDQAGAYTSLAVTIVFAIISGFLAPVARDLVSAIEKWGA
ncbi:MAG TPA: hypothetical protein VME23_06535 [Terracidiphilus sp.]|nr:hypothetical protein [Terracidiphilus sp.]